jgi:hypothetical protein
MALAQAILGGLARLPTATGFASEPAEPVGVSKVFRVLNKGLTLFSPPFILNQSLRYG